MSDPRTDQAHAKLTDNRDAWVLLATMAQQQVAALKAELALIQEAARDPALSDAAVRAVAAGCQEPTAEDIAWARQVLEQRTALPPAPRETPK